MRWLAGLRDLKSQAKALARIKRLIGGNPGDVKPVGAGVSPCFNHHLLDRAPIMMRLSRKLKANLTSLLAGLVSTMASLSGLASLEPKQAAAVDQFYYSINCISEIALEEPCNVSFMNKSMSIRFGDGRSSKIKYDEIIAWNYTDSSKLKIDTELASRIGIIGLLFKKAVHRHVFSISYSDGFGDKKSVILNFSDTQYVLPVKAALSENTATEIK